MWQTGTRTTAARGGEAIVVACVEHVRQGGVGEGNLATLFVSATPAHTSAWACRCRSHPHIRTMSSLALAQAGWMRKRSLAASVGNFTLWTSPTRRNKLMMAYVMSN